jgi:ATP-dependent DNA helicase RecG
MKPLNEIELLTLLDAPESDRVERKKEWSGNVSEKVRDAVCAFANDLPNHNQPGVIFIGVNDDGTAANIEVSDELLNALADIKSDGKITPPPTLTVEKWHIKGAELAVITVWPSDAPPVRYDGRIRIRTGPRRGLASAQDERLLNEKRRFKDKTFDARPVGGCSISELNRTFFENEFLPQAVAEDVLSSNGRSYEERLASLGMISSVDNPSPTVLGILTLGKSPRSWLPCAYIQFLRINGTELSDPVIDNAEIDGTFDTMLRQLDEKLKAHLTQANNFTSGTTKEVLSAPYPLSALQQLSRNAVMHRIYEGTNSPVRVYWFNDRIEITSPGGPYGMVTAENFGLPGYNDYRNPLIASVLRTLGYVQRFGAGIGIAKKALRNNGNSDPIFHIDPNRIMVTIPCKVTQ